MRGCTSHVGHDGHICESLLQLECLTWYTSSSPCSLKLSQIPTSPWSPLCLPCLTPPWTRYSWSCPLLIPSLPSSTPLYCCTSMLLSMSIGWVVVIWQS